LTPEHRLFRTSNGGTTWEEIDSLPPEAPHRIAAISILDKHTVVVSGSTYPEEGAIVARSTDTGASWAAIDVRQHATIVLDMHFRTRRNGWIVGGAEPNSRFGPDDLIPVVLRTKDGGSTWCHALSPDDAKRCFFRGEIASKISCVGSNVILISVASRRDAAILRSDDGGMSWLRKPVNDQRNLDGIGFLDPQHGWVGGSSDFTFVGGKTSATSDGGTTWQAASDVGFRLARLRFIGRGPTVGYAAGDTVYKFSTDPAPNPFAMVTAKRASRVVEATGFASVAVLVPPAARSLTVICLERAGRVVSTLVRELRPRPGERTIIWDFMDKNRRIVPVGIYILRITIDDRSESRMVFKTI
jgi:photosystem II stability/assembly factor-like uncharacterized protein